jgi:hypothetical protein
MIRLQVHSVAGKIVSIQSSKENIDSRTRDLSTHSAVPQPTAPPRMDTPQIHCHNLTLADFVHRLILNEARRFGF